VIEALSDILQYQFMRHALMTGLLVSIACGIIGTFVVVKRIVFLSGGISHTAYGGIGIGYYLGINPIIGAIVFSLAAAFGIAWVRQNASQREDTLIGVMWATGMAIGIMFIDKTPGILGDFGSTGNCTKHHTFLHDCPDCCNPYKSGRDYPGNRIAGHSTGDNRAIPLQP